MSDQITEKEIIEKLSDMREFIVKLCKEYNDNASKVNLNGRIAFVEANIYDKEESETNIKDKDKTWEEKARSWDYDKSMDINRCDAGAWFPSMICINY